MTDSLNHSERLPPYSIEAEQGVIGAALLDNATIDDVSQVLAADDFHRASLATLWRRIVALRSSGAPVDAVTLADDLIRTGEFKAVGGDETLAECLDRTPHAANAVYHAQIVRNESSLRRLIEASNLVLNAVYSRQHRVDEVIEIAETAIFAVRDRTAAGETKHVRRHVVDARDRIARRMEGECTGVASGFLDFDNLTDGFPAGSLTILAARPSMGKSSIALNVAEFAALKSGVPVLFVSLEMSGPEIAERLLVSGARVQGHSVKTGDLMGSDLTAISHAAAALDASRLWIDDRAGQTITAIAANARRFRAREGIGLLVVDYVQLIEAGDLASPRANEQEQVSVISRRLKALARELGVPVLALSQLNRAVESREDRKPRMSDLRSSGSLEQDADLVLLLHRPDYYDPMDQPGTAALDVAKNRNGRTGLIRLTFSKELARFENFSNRELPIDAF